MPHNDDTDRFCGVCHGKRHLPDMSAHDYAYSARSTTPCWACYVPAQPEAAQLGPDALMDLAIAKLAAAAAMTPAEYRAAEYAANNPRDIWEGH
jgi:hypothetical protein